MGGYIIELYVKIIPVAVQCLPSKTYTILITVTDSYNVSVTEYKQTNPVVVTKKNKNINLITNFCLDNIYSNICRQSASAL